MKRKHTPYLNAYNPDHFVTPRRYDPSWEPERGLHADGVVMIVLLFIALASLLGVWYLEGGL